MPHIIHIVLFKIKKDCLDKVGNMMIQLGSLKSKISGIRKISCGPDFTLNRSQGFTHGLVGKKLVDIFFIKWNWRIKRYFYDLTR